MNHAAVAEAGREYLAYLRRLGNPVDRDAMRQYHKVAREYLGIRAGTLTSQAETWSVGRSESEILGVADYLWSSNVFEAMLSAGRLLELKRLTNPIAIWTRLDRYKEALDSWAVSDVFAHVAFRVLAACPAYLDEMEKNWLTHPCFWVRRVCLVYTLYTVKPPHSPERSLSWAARIVDEREWFIQKAIGWYLRELSKHDPAPVRRFLDQYGARMKPFAVREGSKYLEKGWPHGKNGRNNAAEVPMPSPIVRTRQDSGG